MTVSGGGKALYKVTKISRGELALVIRGIASHRQAAPAIVVDCSILLFALKHMNSITQYLIDLADLGVVVIPVCDNDVRPRVKQETIKRSAKRERARIEEYLLRRQVRVMKRRLDNDPLTQEERLKLLADVKEVESKRKRKETASYRPTIANFNAELERELAVMGGHSTNSAGGYVSTVVTAQFQADTYMAGQIRGKKAVMVLSTDTDIPIITGDCCISINGCSKKDFSLTSTSKATLETAMGFLQPNTNASIKLAEFPIFEGVTNIRLRALMMVILGCDVYPSGYRGFGLKTLSKKIKESQSADNDELYEYLVKMMKKAFEPRLIEIAKERGVRKEELDTTATADAEEVVQTYIDALVYEPTNKAGDKATYIEGKAPEKLARYCEEFVSREQSIGAETEIFPGPTILSCKSSAGREHSFLAACGHDKCAKCNCIVCPFCQITVGVDNSAMYCLMCGATEQFVPEMGTKSAEPVGEKRNRLQQQYKFSDANNLTSDEVEDALERLDFVRGFRAQGEKVPFPLYPSKEMDGIASKWKEITEIHLPNGGSFLGDGSIEQNMVPRILAFFAAAVTFAPPETKHTKWARDSAIYDALPTMVIDFASKSRVDSGYRLIERCVRHALDSKCPSIQKKTVTLIQHGNEVGMHITSAVPASMDKKMYKTGVVFTATDVLCCECDCHCGSEEDEKVVCVHNFPLIFLLSLFIMDALAENMLIEFTACLRSNIWDEDEFSTEDLMSMKESIVTLADAAGDCMGQLDLENISLHNLMNKFETGTEGRKKWKQRCKSKPKPNEHCSILDIGHFLSTAKEAKMLTERRKEGDSLVSVDQSTTRNAVLVEDECTDKIPNYVASDLLINAAGYGEVLKSNAVGWQLFQMRVSEQRHQSSIDTNSIVSQVKSLTKLWCDIIQLASKRTHRSSAQTNGRKRSHDETLLPSESEISNEVSPPLRVSRQSARLLQSNVSHPVTPSPRVSRRLAQKVSKKPHPVTPSPRVSSRLAQKVSKKQKLKVPHGPGKKLRKKQKAKLLRRPGQQLPKKQKPQKPPQLKVSHSCCKDGCGYNNLNCPPGTKWFWVPGPKGPIKSAEPRKDTLINRAGHILLRSEIMDRTMSQRSNKKEQQYVVCSNHMFQEVRKTKVVKLNSGKTLNVTYKLIVPSGDGPSKKPKTRSKGTGRDRGTTRLLNEIQDKEVSWEMCTQRVAECSDTAAESINATVAAAANIPLIVGNAHDYLPSGTKTQFFRFEPITNTTKFKRKTNLSPVVKPGMPDKEVKRRTGFPTESSMLAFIIVVCEGDIETIARRQSILTWYEEWFMTFEYMWNRSINRLEDVGKTYSNLRKEDILRVFDAKLDICSNAHKTWPMFASFEEDKKLQKEKWSLRYNGMRPVMWDMTNITAYSFSNAHFQRLTYSSYYNENCFKAGIFCQPCGWMGVTDLWTGGVSDTDFNRRAGYLQKQHHFQRRDLVMIDGVQQVVRFLNILDKGYRPRMAAWENGKQLVLQPDFKESDKKFNRDQTISSASVASDRGGNERVVNVSKRAGLISKGFHPNSDPLRFNKVWTTWSFQANFMFDPVL